MAAKLEEITAKFLGERQRWGDTIIAELNIDSHGFGRAKGPAEEDELVCGCWYRFFGRWTRHFRYGDQFVFQTFVASRALDEDGIVRYLCRAPGIGPATARKLVNLYGDDAIKTLREKPERCVEESKARGFSVEKAKEAASFLAEDSATETTMVELITLFAGRSLPRALPKKAIQRFGNKAADAIRENPFVLLGFRGVGFAKADELYLELGHDPEAIERQALCAVYRCVSDNDGHTWIASAAIHVDLIQKIGASSAKPREAVQEAIRMGLLSMRRQKMASMADLGKPDEIWFAATERSTPEHEVAESVAGMLHYGVPEWPDVDDLDVSEHQRDELIKALTKRIALFGGSPGTGKTYTAARLISKIQLTHGTDSVAVVAPTGKAAVRITEALSEYRIGLRAKTIHSFLEVMRADDDADDGDFAFARNAQNVVDEKFIVCDESSMNDVWLMSKLLGAMRLDGHLLLVGDVNQLPPVGHGAPLRDLIAFGVPRGDLTEIRRNAGTIVETCAAIRDDRPWPMPTTMSEGSGHNLMLLRAPSRASDAILDILARVKKNAIHDPVWEVQVLVAVNERSELSRVEMNQRIQAALNGSNRPARDAKFWEGDKVVCLKNSFFPAVEEMMESTEDEFEDVVVQEGDDGRPELYVANGELGRVVVDEPTKVIVEFPSPKRVVLVPKGSDGTNKLDLGYALSCHKSQGSEWPIVIVGLDDSGGARMVCDRSWLYTSISRAKKFCVLVGQEKTAREMCKRVKISDRKTFLPDLITEALERIIEHEEKQQDDGRSGHSRSGFER